MQGPYTARRGPADPRAARVRDISPRVREHEFERDLRNGTTREEQAEILKLRREVCRLEDGPNFSCCAYHWTPVLIVDEVGYIPSTLPPPT